MVREGHAIGRFDVVLFAMDSEGEGVLARQQELQNLERELRAQQLLGDEARQQAERIDAMATQRTPDTSSRCTTMNCADELCAKFWRARLNHRYARSI